MFKKNFKKIDIVRNLTIKTGLSSAISKKLIDDLIEIIINNINTGNLILKNIGTFKKKHKKERQGRNPKTKEKFMITSRKSINFTPSKKATDELNKFI